MGRIIFRQRIALIIFGVFLFAAMLETGLRLGGAAYLSLQDYANRREPAKVGPGEYRILCLGESTTALGGGNSYPGKLQKIFNNRPAEGRVVVINRGMPGVDTTTIVSELPHLLNKYSPDMVVTMMGINDMDTDYPGKGVISKLKGFIKTLRAYKAVKLLYERMHSEDILRNMYIESGKSYLDRQRYDEAQEMFQRVIGMSPGMAIGYIWLARSYNEQNDYAQAGKMLNKARRMYFKDGYDYVESGWLYYEMKNLPEAEKMFRTAIELKSDDCSLYIETAHFYQACKLFPQAETMFKKAMGLVKGKDSWPYSAFGWHYVERNMFGQAEDMFKKALEKNNKDWEAYQDLAHLKQAQGDYPQAELYFRKSGSQDARVKSLTARNYNRLKDIVLKRGIKLVCVQYPMRRLEDLKQLFNSCKGITFVDNYKIFKDALSQSSYDDYFTDRFAGDFGHCTSQGNELLAGNIARAILKEYFNFSQ